MFETFFNFFSDSSSSTHSNVEVPDNTFIQEFILREPLYGMSSCEITTTTPETALFLAIEFKNLREAFHPEIPAWQYLLPWSTPPAPQIPSDLASLTPDVLKAVSELLKPSHWAPIKVNNNTVTLPRVPSKYIQTLLSLLHTRKYLATPYYSIFSNHYKVAFRGMSRENMVERARAIQAADNDFRAQLQQNSSSIIDSINFNNDWVGIEPTHHHSAEAAKYLMNFIEAKKGSGELVGIGAMRQSTMSRDASQPGTPPSIGFYLEIDNSFNRQTFLAALEPYLTADKYLEYSGFRAAPTAPTA